MNNPNLDLLAAARRALPFVEDHSLAAKVIPPGHDPGITVITRAQAASRLRLAITAAEAATCNGDGFEIWRDQQLTVLRWMYRNRDPLRPYLSFPDFCLGEWKTTHNYEKIQR